MYVTQLYAGHWYICAYTQAPKNIRMAVWNAKICNTRAEAEAEMARIKETL